jgi:N-methylhydantoinase A
MAQALRVISIQRGVDPREHVLVSFGGAGGLHVCALAAALGMNRALVPVHAGVLSALGMLAAPRARQLSHTLTGVLDGFEEGTLTGELQALAQRGRAELVAEGVPEADIESEFHLDLRYQGQSYTLTLPWSGLGQTVHDFHAAHEQRYGHRLDTAVELVNIRCELHGTAPDIRLPELDVEGGGKPGPEYASLPGYQQPIPVWRRENLARDVEISGPAIITETLATTWLPDDWTCTPDRVGNLQLGRV